MTSPTTHSACASPSDSSRKSTLFASHALFPISMMPDWLKDSAQVNPVTYGTDAARQLILFSPNWTSVMNDFLFLGVFATVFAAIGIVLSWRYLSK